jgi:anaerobic C4-dicarboxylate transporter
MLNKLFEILFAKRLLLLLAWFQSTSIFAQHYSGRHVDEYDGGGSGGFLIIVIACLVIGAVIYFSILIGNSITRTKNDNNPPKKLTIQERDRIEIEKLNNKIQQAKKDHEEASLSIGCFIIMLVLMILYAVFHSCS